MDYLALYRKYRPKELNEVVGQSEIKKILANSIINNTISHAYLFSGPRGTGKTTMAKIYAKMVNCLNPVNGNACNKCDNCVNLLNSSDVIEIDAASNNGVDEIRDLREKANLVPSFAKYKIYIIDEVHMLTTQAFNALLKTLEEPPKHVIFILATTEYYKIPMTITSRCQKFQFTKLSDEDIITKLKEIAKLEKIDISDDALYEIAKISDGGMRDSINFLDQLRSFSEKKVTIDDVYEVCGNVSIFEILDLLCSIKNNDYEKVAMFFEEMNIKGKNYSKFLENLVEFLKDVILFKKNVSYKYIKNEIDNVKKIDLLYSNNDIFYIVECINDLINKLKNVSRQSVVVVTCFFIIMNKLAISDSNEMEYNVNDASVRQLSSSQNNQYDMAFNFTPIDNTDNINLTDNIDNKINEKNKKSDDLSKYNIEKNKEIIINNAFALANKNTKIILQNNMSKLGDYLTDKKYKLAAGSLVDVKIEVAGDNYIILSASSDAVIEKIYKHYKLCHDLLNIINDGEYNFALLNQDEWNNYRNEYVENFKNGKKYVLKELIKDNDTLIKEIKEPTLVDKLFDLVGEDVVEFK